VDIVVPVLTRHARTIIETAADAAARSGKPYALIWTGGCIDDPNLTPAELVGRGVPVFRDIAPGMLTMRRASDHAAFMSSVRAPAVAAFSAEQGLALRRILESFGPKPSEADAKRLLSAAGLAVPENGIARDPREAAAIAERLGGTLAVKVLSGDIGHKWDVGGVRLNVEGGAAAVKAVTEILDGVREKAADARIDGFLVEAMAPAGVEMILGISLDPVLGPIITVGLGGIHAEVLEDVAHRMAPVDRTQALTMLRQLRGWRLLQGFRGAPECDVDALAEAIVRLSQLADALSEYIEAFDLNPVIVAAKGQGATVCDALLIPRLPL
jgi:acetyltransferase